MCETTSEQIINTCKAQFARHGIPGIVVSDNGLQFSSWKFKEFARVYQFSHHTSSPHYPQSNGKAERAVQTVENFLKKRPIWKIRTTTLHCLHFTTPQRMTVSIGSPAQRLMGRWTKTLLPTPQDLLAPKTIRPSAVKSNIQSRQKGCTPNHYQLSSQASMSASRRNRLGSRLWLKALTHIPDHITSQPHKGKHTGETGDSSSPHG